MLEIVWQYDPERGPAENRPQTAAAALARLDSGNATFSTLTTLAGEGSPAKRHIMPIGARDLGLPDATDGGLAQQPFAAILGCADARVPLEVVFGLPSNQAFVVRVAGNVLGNECLGSLEYAVANLESLRLLLVLGHTQCGAVTAAVDAYLNPTSYLQMASSLPLRSIVDSLMVPVRAAAEALEAVHGRHLKEHAEYRTAVIEVAVALNAALTASIAARNFSQSLGSSLGVAFGVFNLETRRVGLPGDNLNTERWLGGLFAPPKDESGFHDLGRQLAGSAYVVEILS